MTQLEQFSEILRRAAEAGAGAIRVQLDQHFVIEATLSPQIQTQKIDPHKEKQLAEDLAFYSS